MTTPLSYESTGVRYDVMDPFKLACQKTAAETSPALAAFGFREVPNTRGESCYLFETEREFLAHVEEALGTKTLVADAMYKLTNKSYYKNVAIDDFSTIVNDLLVSGALPVTIAMYAAVGDSAYLADPIRAADLAAGFAEGCRLAGAAWSGGETQTLKGMVNPDTIILGGSALGRIAPKHHRITGHIVDRDDILFLASSGVHTNGLTLCRALADRLPQGYLTPLPDGTTYGEALLAPSIIYARFIAACQRENIPLHYAVHLTGHGWRKLMRATDPFVYRIDQVPTPQPVFDVITRAANLDPREAYGTFNMGVGFAVYLDPNDTQRALTLAATTGLTAWHAGKVLKERDRKAVEIPSLNITYEADSLHIR